MKNNWWSKLSEELQSFADQNKSREFFAATRKLYGPTNNGVRPVMCKDGNICKDKQGIKERWKEHFSELLNQTAVVDPSVIDKIPQHLFKRNWMSPPQL